jgi:hypothetical protein
MWAALLGAFVGGFFALAGGFSIEFRAWMPPTGRNSAA